MTRESLIEWTASWVPEMSPYGEAGQRERFAKAIAEELKEWCEPAQIAAIREAAELVAKHYDEGHNDVPGAVRQLVIRVRDQ